jgi:hypothetical protein
MFHIKHDINTTNTRGAYMVDLPCFCGGLYAVQVQGERGDPGVVRVSLVQPLLVSTPIQQLMQPCV